MTKKPGSNGIHAAMLTPFHDDESIAVEGIGPLVDYILANGVDGLYAGGSSGECILQSRPERELLLRELAHYAKGKCTLIAHVGAASTADAVAMAKVAAQSGYDYVSAIPPYYYPHSKAGIADYYKAIVDASGIPLIIYNIPALTGVDIGTDGLLDLLEDDRIAGVKFTATDLFQFWKLRRSAPDKSFFFGTDEMFLAAVATGADGGIGSTYNLIGNVYVGICEAITAGDIEKARQLQSVSNELVQVLLTTGVLPGLKHSLNRLGVTVGRCRQPFTTPSSESLAQLDQWIDKHLATGLLKSSNL
ncbi:MAG: N-acetylneuraminate lyase [Granulosicoccus sp.]|jgi:N-acetylneuraminate lyase